MKDFEKDIYKVVKNYIAKVFKSENPDEMIHNTKFEFYFQKEEDENGKEIDVMYFNVKGK